MEGITFDKDKIKISRINMHEGSVYGVGFEQEGKKFFVKGHSKAQALCSIPYKQYRLDGFTDVLNRYFGAESEYIKAKEQIETYLGSSLSYLDSLDRFKEKSIVLKGHPEITDDITKAQLLIIKAVKAVKSL